jgi:general secretion pathway protein K
MRADQRGIALLMAMLVVAISALTATRLISDQAFMRRRSFHQIDNDRLRAYALGLEDFARLMLQKDARDSKTDHLGEGWAVGIPGLPIEGGMLSGRLIDAQSRVNLNSLPTDPVAEQVLRGLCRREKLSCDFIDALKDWIDEDSDVRFPDGAEDDYYINLQPSYRSANRPMIDRSELRLVKGVDAESYRKLKPYIIALPEPTKLNINTLPKPVFEALAIRKRQGEGTVDADRFIDERDQDDFASLEDFEKRMKAQLTDEQKKALAVNTRYFLAEGQVLQNDSSLLIHALIERDGDSRTRVLWRRFGAFL